MKRILVVEDNPMNMMQATDLLERDGYVVTQAESAEAGVALAAASRYDLILMDVSLPGQDGLWATRVLRQQELTSRTPIVALTAHTTNVDQLKAFQAGCTGFLAKPIEMRSFLEAVASFF